MWHTSSQGGWCWVVTVTRSVHETAAQARSDGVAGTGVQQRGADGVGRQSSTCTCVLVVNAWTAVNAAARMC